VNLSARPIANLGDEHDAKPQADKTGRQQDVRFGHPREFAESADELGLPDSTPVKCWVSDRDEVYSLETEIKDGDSEAVPSDGEIPSAPGSITRLPSQWRVSRAVSCGSTP
jgi:hypothetical protein